MLSYTIVLILFIFTSSHALETKPYHMSYIVDRNNETSCQILKMGFVAKHRMLSTSSPIYVSVMPQSLSEEKGVESDKLVKVYAITKEIAEAYFHSQCKEWTDPQPGLSQLFADEVIPLVITGSPSNRIDLVFMGDGYTELERETMISDMKRLVDDMFTGSTFSSYIPLFNVWIVFRPSLQSGIGTGGVPRNTAFRLYRDGTELRGVYCGNPQAARDACTATGTDACDFPTLIGNSPYYGGLGGEFTIATSSETSGTIVLRHELGHNFGEVGEEYDGGSAYFGANFANTLPTANSKWRAWLSENPIKAEDAQLRLQDYPWYLLENGPKSYTFTSDGNYKKWFLHFTASGCPEPESLGVILDGVPLEWEATGSEDRIFYSYFGSSGFSAGTHTLRFEQKFPPTTSKRQLCSLTLHEYKDEPDFHWDNNYYSAYKTWRIGNVLAGYRPTNEYCLMRNMSSPHFCNICQENMWLQFFKQVSAIDGINVACAGTQVVVKLDVIPLAQFRSHETLVPEETYSLEWSLNGNHIISLDNRFEWTMDKSSAVGNWTVNLDFVTPQVRQDPTNLLKFVDSFYVGSGPCDSIQ